MNAAPTTHPPAQAVCNYVLGKLVGPDADAIERHLAACAACRATADQAAADSFLGKVRAAHATGSATRLPEPVGPAAAAANPPTAADLPSELAAHPKYRIVRELGRGGMGVVYQAEHLLMERPIALKVLNPSILDHPEALARFHAEVKAAAQLDHPNIVRALDADCVSVAKRDGEAGASQPGGLHLLVMEFIEGEDLASVVRRKGPLPVAHACHFIRQAALGLQHAFEKGMVHRDIKPQNLMLNPRGQVKILDFGLARVRNQPGRQQLTKLDAFMGTPDFVAPEQAVDARRADIRADIYSLGCTLYCLLTGRPPFAADTAVQVILAHLEQEAPPARDLRPDLPEELTAVLRRMMAKEPAQRYQSPLEVAQALAPFTRTAAKGGKAPSGPANPASPTQGTVLPTDTSRLPMLPGVKGATPAAGASPFEGLDAPTAAAPKAKSKAVRKGQRTWVAAGAAGMLALAVVAAAVVIWVKIKTPGGTVEITVQTSGDNNPNPKLPPPPPPRPAGGFVPLFNGTDLTGWEVSPSASTAWKVEDGVLVSKGKGPSFLATRRADFADFELRLETRINQGGNSGVFVRTLLPRNAGLPPGYEAHINGGEDRFKTGSLFVFGPRGRNLEQVQVDREMVQPNQWFKMTVVARGNRITVAVNGTPIAEYTDVKSRHERGRIGLQQFLPTTVVEFRTIEIKELLPAQAAAPPPPNGFVPLFNGKNLGDWEPVAKSAPGNPGWHVANGVLVSGGAPSLLVYRGDEFENFHLRAEVAINQNGNSGVLFRADADKPTLGYQADLTIYSGPGGKTGSLVGAGEANRLVPKNLVAPGQWFTVEVIAHGNRLQVKVDGQTTVDVEDRKNTYQKGVLVLEQKGPHTQVQFRRIEIQELPATGTPP